jgi:DNA invertase Pin-like site-specific DNA recombinase
MIGYASFSSDKKDFSAQQGGLLKLGIAADRIYKDKGFRGTNRAFETLVAIKRGRRCNTLVLPKLDRLARSAPEARASGDQLAKRGP